MLLGSDDEPLGLILVAAPPVLLFGWPVAWLAFGLALDGRSASSCCSAPGRDESGLLSA